MLLALARRRIAERHQQRTSHGGARTGRPGGEPVRLRHRQTASDGLCGAFRPGHFDGVATVVTKLFLQTGADLAFFGEKDFQQLHVVRQLVRDLDIQIEIIGNPTVRESGGLAMSSRKIRLSSAERRTAPKLPEILFQAARRLTSGELVERTLRLSISRSSH
ncbi:4-phosphopantoate--beta-alanine ligase [Mesorhizobium waimense]|uniref:pantoate--beta-alanine ligase (AMP-forming) n=1 Tax=Mesorhizobium waimense TaxID=1300307 RepID=A0A3A5L3J2_9HYPH|nr:4-phosphopantoate--beta-alanine ligase [Mesorhizobium waimense]